MKTQEFINELRKALANLPAREREEILRDQEEYLHEASLAGRNEEEVIQGLGNPQELAISLNVAAKINQVEGAAHSLPHQIRRLFGAVLAILALAPFNFFIVLWPFLLGVFLNFLGWLFALGSLATALFVLGILFSKLIFFPVGFWTHLSAFFFSLGWVLLGCLFTVMMVMVTREFILLTLRYLKWNLNLVKGKPGRP